MSEVGLDCMEIDKKTKKFMSTYSYNFEFGYVETLTSIYLVHGIYIQIVTIYLYLQFTYYILLYIHVNVNLSISCYCTIYQINRLR